MSLAQPKHRWNLSTRCGPSPVRDWKETATFSGRGLSISPSRDRKSTRLNSSHRTISYAVFCLKKKNKQTKNNPQHNKHTSPPSPPTHPPPPTPPHPPPPPPPPPTPPPSPPTPPPPSPLPPPPP